MYSGHRFSRPMTFFLLIVLWNFVKGNTTITNTCTNNNTIDKRRRILECLVDCSKSNSCRNVVVSLQPGSGKHCFHGDATVWRRLRAGRHQTDIYIPFSRVLDPDVINHVLLSYWTRDADSHDGEKQETSTGKTSRSTRNKMAQLAVNFDSQKTTESALKETNTRKSFGVGHKSTYAYIHGTPQPPTYTCIQKLTSAVRKARAPRFKYTICRGKQGNIKITRWDLFSLDTLTGSVFIYDAKRKRKSLLIQYSGYDLMHLKFMYVHARSCRLFLCFRVDVIEGFLMRLLRFDGNSGGDVIVVSKVLIPFIDWLNGKVHVYYIDSNNVLMVSILLNGTGPLLALGRNSDRGCFAGHSASKTIMHCTRNTVAGDPKMHVYRLFLVQYDSSRVTPPCHIFDVVDSSLSATFVTATRIALLFANRTLVFREVASERFTVVHACEPMFNFAFVNLWENEIYMVCGNGELTRIQRFDPVGRLRGRTDMPSFVYPFISD